MVASMANRTALVQHITNETTIQVRLGLDGGPLEPLPDHAAFNEKSSGIPAQTVSHHASQSSPRQQIWIWTGIGFLDHMLHAWAKHAGWSLRIRTKGDLITEDTFLALGAAFDAALGARNGLTRFGHAYAPLDEALARAVLDISGRPYFVGTFEFKDPKIGALTTQMIPHCLQSFSQRARVTLHIDVLRGDNDHHRAEAAFKALAVACRAATKRIEGWEGEVASTKGNIG